MVNRTQAKRRTTRRPLRKWVRLALFLGVLVPSPLHAEEHARASGTLVWTAPPECPSEPAVENEIARILGASKEPREHVTARAIVTRSSSSRWHAALLVRTAETTSERSFDAASCGAIASATALIVALAIDARAAPPSTPAPFEAASPAEPVPSSPRGEPELPAPVSEVRAPDATSRPTTEARTARRGEAPIEAPRRAAAPTPPLRLHAIAALAIAADRGTLPSSAFGAALSAGALLAGERWNARVEVAGAYWASQSAPLAALPNERGRFSLLDVALHACASAAFDRVDIGPCLGAAIDHVDATSFGTSVPLRGSATWGLVSAGGTAGLRVTERFAVRARLEALAPLARPRFVVEEPSPAPPSEAHRPAPIAGRAEIGVELRFF